MVTKKDLTEQEIRTRYIMPAIREAGWTLEQIREELYLTDGQLYPRGQTALRSEQVRGLRALSPERTTGRCRGQRQ
jgi:type I site-specific restriction endonuclease